MRCDVADRQSVMPRFDENAEDPQTGLVTKRGKRAGDILGSIYVTT